jgi:hypothetical protein
LKRIALGSGAGLTELDMEYFQGFAKYVVDMTEFASQRNCLLYVDAEQSYMQRAIESFGQQLTHTYNVGTKHIILNGY